MVTMQKNGFFEYLELQGGDGRLVTKSELLNEVRLAGFPVSPRKLTFYISEELVPQSVRAGSRAGVYPSIVVDLMIWILAMREAGASIDTLRELLPVWKFLVRAVRSGRLDIAELEYVARQFATSPAAQFAVPRVVSHVMRDACCPDYRGKITMVDKTGKEYPITDAAATIGFAIARPLIESDDEDDRPLVESVDEDDLAEDDEEVAAREWIAMARITLANKFSPNEDPTVVRMGRKLNEPMPPDERDLNEHAAAQDPEEGANLQSST